MAVFRHRRISSHSEKSAWPLPESAVVVQLHRQDDKSQDQGHGVGSDDWEGAEANPVDQPQGNSKTEEQKHGERNVVCTLAAPDSQDLGYKRDGGADGGDRADPVQRPAWNKTEKG